jgi:hypothetical protein
VYNDGVGYVDRNGTYREASEFVNGEAVAYRRHGAGPGYCAAGGGVCFLGAVGGWVILFGGAVWV